MRRREGGKYREREGRNVKSESLEFGDKISPTLSNAFSANNSTFWLAAHKVINGMEKMKCGDIVLHHHTSSPKITNEVQVNQSKVYKICTLAERHWRRLTQAKKKRQNFFCVYSDRIRYVLYIVNSFNDSINPWYLSTCHFSCFRSLGGYNLWQFITCKRDTNQYQHWTTHSYCWFICNAFFSLSHFVYCILCWNIRRFFRL